MGILDSINTETPIERMARRLREAGIDTDADTIDVVNALLDRIHTPKRTPESEATVSASIAELRAKRDKLQEEVWFVERHKWQASAVENDKAREQYREARKSLQEALIKSGHVTYDHIIDYKYDGYDESIVKAACRVLESPVPADERAAIVIANKDREIRRLMNRIEWLEGWDKSQREDIDFTKSNASPLIAALLRNGHMTPEDAANGYEGVAARIIAALDSPREEVMRRLVEKIVTKTE